MLVIRLRRGGKSHEPHYRIVVQEKRSKLNGKYIDSFGHYHPILKDQDKRLFVEKEKALGWISKGATPSVTVNNLLVKAGVLGADKKISRVFSNKKKTAVEKAKSEDVKPEEPAEDLKAEQPIEDDAKAVEDVEKSNELKKSEQPEVEKSK